MLVLLHRLTSTLFVRCILCYEMIHGALFFSSAKKRVFAQMNKKKLLFFNSFVVPRTTLHLERGMVNFLRMKVKSSKEKAICCLGRCLLIYEN